MKDDVYKDYDVKLVDGWIPPQGEDLRPLIAMPNIPKPLHGVNPRILLGSGNWNKMRKACYEAANDTCEICGAKPENLRHRHGHEVFRISYSQGIAKFVRVFCVCSLCHLACIHTGRAITLWKQNNPLYPTEFLLQGAEHAFKIINEYNKDHPETDLRAYAMFLEYLKYDGLKEPMEKLIKKYDMKFYTEVTDMVDWSDWKLLIGDNEYPTPYQNEKDWEEAMKERSKNDTARMAVNRFDSEIYNELDKIIKEENERS